MTRPEDRLQRQAVAYEITIGGRLAPDWSDYFGGLTITTSVSGTQMTTTLTGQLIDQAALMGVLNNLYNLSFIILSVESRFAMNEEKNSV